jgi:hypothetical protein
LSSFAARSGRAALVATVASLVVALSPDAAVRAQTDASDGAWVPPVAGAVARPFAEPIAAYAAGHRGVDLSASAGTPVRAANDGVVSFAGDVAGSLHVVVAHSGGIRTSYSFLSAIEVHVGDAVRRGQVIGRAGGSGEGHGPGILHFGARVGDRYVDPMLLFRPRDLTEIVRLVPADERVGGDADVRVERRELERWIDSQFDGCAFCGAADWVADRAAEALDAGVGLLEGLGDAGRALAASVADTLDSTLAAVIVASDEVRVRLLATPAGRMLDDFVTAGAALLGWFGRECDDHAPPADGRGGSGNAMLAVGGLDSHREQGDDRSFELPAEKLGYRSGEQYWFSYRKGSEQYTKQDTYGDLRRKAVMLGAQLKRAAREQPGRSFDLIGHSQGGVVIALFLATVYRGHEAEYPPIDNVVTFASPLKGTPLGWTGNRVERNPLGRALMEGLGAADLPIPDPTATAIRQLAEGSDVIRDIERAGIPDGISFTSIAGVADWEVPVSSTRLDGARQQAVDAGGPGDSHRAITANARALMAARAGLEHRALPCTSLDESIRASAGATLLSSAERYLGQLVPAAP